MAVSRHNGFERGRLSWRAAAALLCALVFLQPLAAGMTLPEGGRDESPSREIVAFRSNLLVPLLNIGVEVPVARGWSVEGDWYFPWLRPELLAQKACFEALHASVGARYWFASTMKGQMTGHSLALVGGWASYDFGIPRGLYRILGRSTGDWTMKGRQGSAVMLSADYKYSFRVGSHLRMEAGLALGVVRHTDTGYVQYSKGGPLLSEVETGAKTLWYVGPTRVYFNIVIPIREKK